MFAELLLFALLGPGHNPVHVVGHHADGSVFYDKISYNLRTDAGVDWQAAVMGSDTRPPQCNYVAISGDTTQPAATDTALAGEIQTNNLQRVQGTWAHAAGQHPGINQFTIVNHFQPSSSSATIAKVGVLNAPTAGTLCFENMLSSPITVNVGDTLDVTYTITF